MKKHKKVGFTLVEAIVAGAISLVLLMAVFSLFLNSRFSWSHSVNTLAVEEEGELAMKQIEQDLSRAAKSYITINASAITDIQYPLTLVQAPVSNIVRIDNITDDVIYGADGEEGASIVYALNGTNLVRRIVKAVPVPEKILTPQSKADNFTVSRAGDIVSVSLVLNDTEGKWPVVKEFKRNILLNN